MVRFGLDEWGIVNMSYIRAGHELKWFDKESESYVFESVGNNCPDPVYYNNQLKEFRHSEPCDCFVEDYGDNYEDRATFVDLIGRIILRETQDTKYATKMVVLLAQRLFITELLKPEYQKLLGESLVSTDKLNELLKEHNAIKRLFYDEHNVHFDYAKHTKGVDEDDP